MIRVVAVVLVALVGPVLGALLFLAAVAAAL